MIEMVLPPRLGDRWVCPPPPWVVGVTLIFDL